MLGYPYFGGEGGKFATISYSLDGERLPVRTLQGTYQ